MPEESLWGRLSRGVRRLREFAVDEEAPLTTDLIKEKFQSVAANLETASVSMNAGDQMMQKHEELQKKFQEAGDDPLKQARASLEAIQTSKSTIDAQLSALGPEMAAVYRKQLESAEEQLKDTIAKLEKEVQS